MQCVLNTSVLLVWPAHIISQSAHHLCPKEFHVHSLFLVVPIKNPLHPFFEKGCFVFHLLLKKKKKEKGEKNLQILLMAFSFSNSSITVCCICCLSNVSLQQDFASSPKFCPVSSPLLTQLSLNVPVIP